jgi:hypothetical protein
MYGCPSVKNLDVFFSAAIILERSWLAPTCNDFYHKRFITKCLQLGCADCTANTATAPNCNKWPYIYESRACQYYDQICQELSSLQPANRTRLCSKQRTAKLTRRVHCFHHVSRKPRPLRTAPRTIPKVW